MGLGGLRLPCSVGSDCGLRVADEKELLCVLARVRTTRGLLCALVTRLEGALATTVAATSSSCAGHSSSSVAEWSLQTEKCGA